LFQAAATHLEYVGGEEACRYKVPDAWQGPAQTQLDTRSKIRAKNSNSNSPPGHKCQVADGGGDKVLESKEGYQNGRYNLAQTGGFHVRHSSTPQRDSGGWCGVGDQSKAGHKELRAMT
jgi:hypothetical protein